MSQGGFLDDLVLEEGGIQACVERWRNVAFAALLLEMAGSVLGKPPTRNNIVEWMEARLREDNDAARAQQAKELGR